MTKTCDDELYKGKFQLRAGIDILDESFLSRQEKIYSFQMFKICGVQNFRAEIKWPLSLDLFS